LFATTADVENIPISAPAIKTAAIIRTLFIVLKGL
jgi:hypothetical protein